MTGNGPRAVPSTRRIIGYGAVLTILFLIEVTLIKYVVHIIAGELSTIMEASQGPTRDMTEVEMTEILFGGLGATDMAVALFITTSFIVVAYIIAYGLYVDRPWRSRPMTDAPDTEDR